MKKSTEIQLEIIKKIQVDILYKVHIFCIKNDIKYSLAYGTLLGAIRHGGYIPWDDDIDIMMLRPDYDKFIHSFSNAYDNLSICAPELDLNYYAPYANVWDNRTILKENKESEYLNDLHRGKDIGVKIDIFPIDAIPNGSKLFLKYKFKLLTAMKYSFVKEIKHQNFLKQIFSNLLCIIAKLIGYRNIQKMIINFAKSYDLNKSERVDMITFDYKERDFSKSSFNDIVDVSFEQYKFKAISNYDEFLRASYGDYMKLPPIEEQKPHHSFSAFWK